MKIQCSLEELTNSLASEEAITIFDKTVLGGLAHLSPSNFSFVTTIKYHLPSGSSFIMSSLDATKNKKDIANFDSALSETFDRQKLYIVNTPYCHRKKKGSNIEEDLFRKNIITGRAKEVLQEASANHLHPGTIGALFVAMYLSDKLSDKYLSDEKPISIELVSKNIGIDDNIINSLYGQGGYNNIICSSAKKFMIWHTSAGLRGW